MSRLANHYTDIPDEVLEAALAAALSTPDPDQARVAAAMVMLSSSSPSPGAVAECMIHSVVVAASH